MLHSVAAKLADILFEGRNHDDEYGICAYGLELFLYSVFSTLGLILIGILFNSLSSCLIIICVFYILQTCGGGKHANSHLMCFGVMSFFLCIALLLCPIKIPNAFLLLISSSSSVYMLAHPLVLHRHKKYLQYKRQQLELISRITTVAITLIFYLVILLNAPTPCRNAFCFGVLYASLSRHFGRAAKKTCHKDADQEALKET